MDSGWKSWMTGVGATASLVVLSTTMCNAAFFEDESASDDEARAEYQFNPWAEAREESPPPPIEVDPPAGQKRWVYLVDEDDRPVESEVLVGAPGIWPFVERSSDEAGYFELPQNGVQRLGGGNSKSYKIVARSRGGDGTTARGFWGMIEGPGGEVPAHEGQRVQLEEARDLDLQIVDTEGTAVDEAYIRLAKGSVGLVQLNETTDADGYANFYALAPGSYYLTIDADGYARTTVTVDHSTRMSGTLQITLNEGGGLRSHQAWRSPSIHDLSSSEGPAAHSSSLSGVGSTTGSLAGLSPADLVEESAPGSEGAESEPAAPEATVDIDIRVAERRGSGVSGAWIEVWSDDQRVARGESRGRQTVTLEVPAESSGLELVATHAGWGQGTKSIGRVNDGDDFIVRLDSELLSSSAATDRIVGRGEIEEALEIDLVDDGRNLRIDRPRRGSRAAEAGLQRSDALLFVRRDEAGYVAVVERDGNNMEVRVR